MDTPIYPQVIEKLSKSTNILIVTAPAASGDDLAAAAALKSFLSKLEKEVLVVALGGLNSNFSFLLGMEEARTELNVTKSFVVDISTKRIQIEELSYKKEADKLSVFIKPKQGQFTSEDVSFRTSNFPFDAIVCVGIASLDSLGEFYVRNTDLFFETPIINIDRSPANENYGQFNLVTLSATANSEIIFDLINNFESSLIDEHIATSLLTGIIVETNSFQHVRTTPAAFLKASQLVSLGADQPAIIGRLYKNKSLGFLKLWGRVLARIKQEPGLSLVYSMINGSDVAKSGATADDIGLIIKEMALQLSFAKTCFFLVEEADQVRCFAISHSPVNLNQLFLAYQPTPLGQAVRFEIKVSVSEAEQQILAKLKEAVS